MGPKALDGPRPDIENGRLGESGLAVRHGAKLLGAGGDLAGIRSFVLSIVLSETFVSILIWTF